MSDVILFDLDGTLMDSAEGITKCVQYALSHFGIRVSDPGELNCFVGPPLKEQFMEYGKLSAEQAEQAVEYYRERYTTIGIYENRPYDRVDELLQVLRESGRILGIASSKPTVFVEDILRQFHLRKYFDAVVGSELDGTRTDKAEVIEEALRQLGYEERRECALMVGDRRHDVEGAKRCGLQCVGAAYGYGGREELEKAGAVYIAESVEDLGILAGPDDDEPPPAKKPQERRKRNEVTGTAAKEERQEKRRTEMKDNSRKPMSRGRQLWRALYPIGMHYLISVAVAVAGAYALTLWYTMHMAGASSEEILYRVAKGSLLLTGITSICAGIPAYLLFRADCKRREAEEKQLSPLTVLAAAALAVPVGHVLNILISLSHISDIFTGYQQIQETTFSDQPLWQTFAVLVLLAPAAEELIFRGLVQNRLKEGWGVRVGIVLSALLFGAYHGNMVQFIYAFLMGLLLAALYEKTHSIWIPIAAHMASNAWSAFGTDLLMAASGVFPQGALAVFCVEALLGAAAFWYLFLYRKKS